MSKYHLRPARSIDTLSDILIEADNFERDNNELPTRYRLMFKDPPGDGVGMMGLMNINFQHGPVKVAGRNGVSEEALIAILIDRLESHQKWDYFACDENNVAIRCLQNAWDSLKSRTKDRQDRGVKGTLRR